MTTRALRKTLEWVQEQLEDALSGPPFSRAQTALDEMRLRDAKAALAEVEAIKRAAKGWWGEQSRRHSAMTLEEKATLESIAEEAP